MYQDSLDKKRKVVIMIDNNRQTQSNKNHKAYAPGECYR